MNIQICKQYLESRSYVIIYFINIHEALLLGPVTNALIISTHIINDASSTFVVEHSGIYYG